MSTYDTLPLGSLTLTYMGSTDTYSTYRDRDGLAVYLEHRTSRRLVTLAELDLNTLWREYSTRDYRDLGHEYAREDFREYVAALVIDDPEDIGQCDDCEDWHRDDEMSGTGDGTTVCEHCRDEYYWCYDCEETFRETTTVNDREVCESCLSSYSCCNDCGEYSSDENTTTVNDYNSICESCLESYSWCDECEEYYSYDDDHSHGGCDCEAPHQSFTVRNDGDAPLANDTRATITLPAGVISAEGIHAIARLLRDGATESLSYELESLGDKWQTKEGNYTKRLSRYAYKVHGLKLSPEIVSAVGNIASAHSTAVSFDIEVTRDLNLSAAEFGHEDSCYWQSYASSRCALKMSGGLGLRTFGGYGVTGRAWVIPLRQDGDYLVPTHDTDTPDAFIVFNGYGDLQGYAPARVMAHMAGWTYRKVSFYGSPMYVNGNAGYLIAPEALADEFTDGSLSLDMIEH